MLSISTMSRRLNALRRWQIYRAPPTVAERQELDESSTDFSQSSSSSETADSDEESSGSEGSDAGEKGSGSSEESDEDYSVLKPRRAKKKAQKRVIKSSRKREKKKAKRGGAQGLGENGGEDEGQGEDGENGEELGEKFYLQSVDGPRWWEPLVEVCTTTFQVHDGVARGLHGIRKQRYWCGLTLAILNRTLRERPTSRTWCTATSLPS